MVNVAEHVYDDDPDAGIRTSARASPACTTSSSATA